MRAISEIRQLKPRDSVEVEARTLLQARRDQVDDSPDETRADSARIVSELLRLELRADSDPYRYRVLDFLEGIALGQIHA